MPRSDLVDVADRVLADRTTKHRVSEVITLLRYMVYIEDPPECFLSLKIKSGWREAPSLNL